VIRISNRCDRSKKFLLRAAECGPQQAVLPYICTPPSSYHYLRLRSSSIGGTARLFRGISTPTTLPPHIVINTCRRRIRVKRCWDITFVTGGLSVFRIKLALIKSSWGVWISPGLGWSISFTFSRPSLVPFSQSLLFENLKRNNLNKKECVPSISSVWICCCFFFVVVRFLTFESLERLRTLHLFAVMNIGTTIFPHLKFWNNSDFFLRFNPCSLVMPRSTCDECYINRAGRSEKSRSLNLIFYIFEKLAK
jgi:hypothetical protein